MAAPMLNVNIWNRAAPLVVVLGATGAGKSKLAIELATKYKGEIISADSMQVYSGLDIATNKGKLEERRSVPHHLLDFVNPLLSTFTVTDFQKTALPVIDNILQKHRLPIIVGGTNYYIESILWNFLLAKQQNDTPGLENSSASTTGSTSERFSKEKHNVESPQYDLYPELTTAEIFHRLEQVDTASAARIHPHDRRKVSRALQVYEEHGKPLSELLSAQHEQQGTDAVRGSLRYPLPCVIWVKCEQEALHDRTDARVDQMLEQGLLSELENFHDEYNDHSRKTVQDDVKNRSPPYSQGIFQCIGLKEFHAYLILSPVDKASQQGQKCLNQCIENLKCATRQYARKQLKWIKNRFLKQRGVNIPPVYPVDSTHATQWNEDVYKPAAAILEAYLQCETPQTAALEVHPQDNPAMHNVCEICQLVFVTKKDWQNHINGHRHKKRMKKKRLAEIRQAHSGPDKQLIKTSESQETADLLNIKKLDEHST